MNTYNYYLYNKRTFLRLSYGKMGKALGMGGFRYRLIENGYLKPKHKEIERFSAFFGEDFTPYVDSYANNPCDLPKKKEMRIATFLYELVGKIWVRVLLGLLTGCFAGLFGASFILSDMVDNKGLSYYPETYQTFVSDLQENGEQRISLLGSFITPEIHHSYEASNGYPAYVYIYGEYKMERATHLSLAAVYRGDGYRAEFTVTGYNTNLNSGKKALTLTATITSFEYDYRDVEVYEYYSPTEYSDSKSMREILSRMDIGPIMEPLLIEADKLVPIFVDDLNDLLADTKYTETNLTVTELLTLMAQGDEIVNRLSFISVSFYLVGLIMAGLCLFGFLFAMFYGRKKGGKMPFTRSYVAIVDPPEEGKKPLKKDIRFAPFIPETVLELLGIALVFYGSMRAVGYVGSFFGLEGLGLGEFMNGGSMRFMSVFMIGMFLLYIIDFDAYMEDSRIVRLIFQNAIIFICLYNLEVLLINGIEAMSVLGGFAERIPIPNMFGSIACYFLIAYCLFFTPKWAKKSKGRLVLHRLCAIIPISWILAAWIIYRGNGIWFKLDWSREVLFLFNGERLTFSILAILYLVGYYLIRLFFEKKLGETNANVFFNSNRFIWIRNIYLSLIILGVGIAELILRNNIIANKLDFGYYWQILFLIPAILLYHPHKGPRNTGVDILTTGIYMACLIFAYALAALTVLLGIIINMS